MTFNINIKDLVSAGNVRSDVDAGLAPSIRENGIKYPIAVYLKDDTWIVQEGHRRLMGAIVAGLESVPCVEVDAPVDDANKIADQYIINQHRKELSYLDRANVYQRLIQEFGWTQKKTASKFGVSEAEVSLSLSALRSHPIIRDAILNGSLKPSAAEVVTSLSLEDQEQVADAVVHARTVRGVTDVVRAYKKSKMVRVSVEPTQDYEEDVDPLELMAVEAIETALTHLRMASTIQVTDITLTRRVMDSLAEISSLSQSMAWGSVEEVEYGYETN